MPAARWPPAPTRWVLRLLDSRHVERELDLVADEHVAAAERLVEPHPVVATRELAGDLQADAVVAPGVDVRALDLGFEDDGLRDAVEREVAGDAERVVADDLDAGRLEGHLGVVLGVEEVARAQVLVACGLVRVDRGDLDGAVGPGGGQVLADLQRAGEVCELAADVGDAHVLDGEADLRVRRIDVPGAGGDERCGGGGHGGAPGS